MNAEVALFALMGAEEVVVGRSSQRERERESESVDVLRVWFFHEAKIYTLLL